MPQGNGTGPPEGQKTRAGRNAGSRRGAGPGGDCVCPSCGERQPHQQGVPCYNVPCPKCGTKMVRA